MKKKWFFALISATLLTCFFASCNSKQNLSAPPEWAKSVVWYQIFVERFSNGDTTNDPTPQTMFSGKNNYSIPADWKLTPWNSEWYSQDEWSKKAGIPFKESLQLRRYGGDLQGVINKLGYLSNLGVTALYINPLNDAPSMHKYDARNYHHIDVNFGPDPLGDIKLMATENPADASTWVWTSADKLFLKLIDEAHKLNMKIILDYSWNHTGVEFWAWKDVVKNQEKSIYKDWYNITKFDDPKTPENEFEYKGWYNIASLPELKKVNITTERINGKPYEGDMNEGAKKHIFEVTKRWLMPYGDLSKGLDGYRLDVADQIPMGFWRQYRNYVKSINPNAFLVGEIWWEKWPNTLMNPAPYLQGTIFDAVMFYQLYKPARYFFANTDSTIDATQFKQALLKEWSQMDEEHQYAQMCTNSTHDTQRLLTDFYNKGNYKVGGYPYENKSYRTGKPDAETFSRLHLYLIQQFTNIGAPNIYNGEEMGMWGCDDPDCRKPLMWPNIDFAPERKDYHHPESNLVDTVKFNTTHFEFYKKLIKIRKENRELTLGKLEFLQTDEKLLVYSRTKGTAQIIVALNASTHQKEVVLPTQESYIDLLTNQIVNGGNITLSPLSGMILKPIK